MQSKPSTIVWIFRLLWLVMFCVLIPASLMVFNGQKAPASFATYYVDGQSGNDSNAGTSINSPWKSLDKISSHTFLPGDKVLFKSGARWIGQLWPKGSGKQDHPILIDKYGGEKKPLIEGAGKAEDAVLLKNQQYWEIRNLEITNKGGEGVHRGVHLVAENYGEAHHILISSLDIHDVIATGGSKGSGGIHYTSTGDSKASRFVDLRIEGNHLTHVDRDGITGGSTHWERQKWYPSLGVVIRENVLDDIGGDGIVAVATDGALVEHNVVGHANQRASGGNVAIWAWSADNTIIQHNEAFATGRGHDSEGFDSDWNSRNTIIQYNYSHDNEGGFLLICNDGSVGPEYNIGNTGTIVRYNVSQNDHNKFISIAGPTQNSTIYNNTLYSGKGENADFLSYSDWHGWSDDTSYFNNIFYASGTARFAATVTEKPDHSQTTAPGMGQSTKNSFDSNLYYGVTPIDDTHAIVADPILIAPGNAADIKHLAGYGLRPNSPAINSAVDIPNRGTQDVLGAPVPSCGAADRGALESTSCRNPK